MLILVSWEKVTPERDAILPSKTVGKHKLEIIKRITVREREKYSIIYILTQALAYPPTASKLLVPPSEEVYLTTNNSRITPVFSIRLEKFKRAMLDSTVTVMYNNIWSDWATWFYIWGSRQHRIQCCIESIIGREYNNYYGIRSHLSTPRLLSLPINWLSFWSSWQNLSCCAIASRNHEREEQQSARRCTSLLYYQREQKWRIRPTTVDKISLSAESNYILRAARFHLRRDNVLLRERV